MVGVISVIAGLVILAVAVFAFLGWLLPLIVGLVRRKSGKSCIGLIVFGGVWGCMSLLVALLIGFGIFACMQLQEKSEVRAFNAEEYEGATSTIVVPYKGDSSLTASTEEGVIYSFNTADGKFVVPVGTITPKSYSISKKDAQGNAWTAQWRFHSRHDKPIACTPDGEADLEWGPPLVLKATRESVGGGNQRIGLKVVDQSGHELKLSSAQTPVVQIIDAAGNVVWKHTLEYG